MKGDERIIQKLNDLLTEELTAINQYMVHSEMCESWNYERLHAAAEKRAFVEMKHAERLIERILYLEGKPIVSNLNKISIGQEVEAQHRNDLAIEYDAAKSYNQAITLCAELSDNGTRELLNAILQDEEVHIDELEAQLTQIQQLGIQNYLTEQVRAGA